MASLTNISVDTTYKIEYGKVINKIRRKKNCVGPQLWQTLPTAPTGTYTNADTIFVNTDSGNDTTGTGASATPFKTMAKGASGCTSAKQRVMVTCSAATDYDYDDYPYPVVDNAYYQAMYASGGKTIYWTDRTLGFTPSNTNSIFVSATGNAGGTGTMASACNTIAAASALTASGKQAVVILDSETYDTPAFTFASNFIGLYANYGCTPTLTMNQNVTSTTYTPFTIATTEIDGTGTCSGAMIAKFADDSFVVGWVISAQPQFAMYRNNDYNYKTKTALGVGGTKIYAMFILPISENVVFIWDTGSQLYFQIFDKNGTQVKAQTLVPSSGTPVAAHGAAFSDDSWVVCWCDSAASYGYYFATFDSTGTAVLTRTYISTTTSDGIGINAATQSNNNIIFSYAVYSSSVSNLGISIYTQDGEFVKTLPIQNTGASTGRNSTVVLSSDCFYVMCGSLLFVKLYDSNYNLLKTIDLSTGLSGTESINVESIFLFKNDHVGIIETWSTENATSFTILDGNGNVVFKWNRVIALQSNYVSAFVNNQGDIIYTYSGASNHLQYSRINNYYFIGINVAVAATMNGITIDCENQDYLKYVFTGASNLTRKWCKFKNMSSTYLDEYTNLTKQKISLLTGQLDRRNDYMHDVYNGDDVTSTVAKSYNCIFLNSDGIDFTVVGSASAADNITYRHNTVQNAGGGCYLTASGGTNQTIYNNIFNDVSGYDISSAVACTAYNNISTGDLNNVTSASGSTLNPLFINGGELGASYADLDLKSTTMGDFATSSGIDFGSDGLNAGAYDTLIIGPDDTWSSFTAIKPMDGPTTELKYAGAANLQKKSGAYGSAYEGLSEVITFDHSKSGMLLATWTSFLAAIITKKNEVRFYGCPTTYPTTYNTFTLLYDNFQATGINYKLTATGLVKIKYSIARALS